MKSHSLVSLGDYLTDQKKSFADIFRHILNIKLKCAFLNDRNLNQRPLAERGVTPSTIKCIEYQLMRVAKILKIKSFFAL